ncbi:MAG: hypothetical protein QOH79_1456, partial [Acidimicrobiaceae bacterium]
PTPPAAAGGRGGAAKIVGIAVALALVAGGAAFALTRDNGGGGSVEAFCAKAKALHNDIDLNEAFSDPAKVDKVTDAFGQVANAAPKEIKADIDTLNDAVRKARDATKAGKNASDVFTDEESQKLGVASTNVENFGKEKCGQDFLLSSSSSDSSSSTSSTRSSSSSTRSSSSSSSTSAAGAVTDAVSTRDQMIALAKQPGAVDASAQPPVSEWTRAFPGLDFIGSALPATPDAVSGFTAVFSKAKDVDFMAFAVLDTSGRCAAVCSSSTAPVRP